MNKNQRIAMAEKDLKIKDLGFKLNLHPGYLSNVLAGRYKVPKTRSRIAKILGKDETYLWPDGQIEQR
jgi:lambda repressor-like predicted transcriptional regulator